MIEPNTPISDESMEKLAKILNDSPTKIKLADTEWSITTLKPGTQWLIAEEACRIIEVEHATMGDVIAQFSGNLESVARVITLALLNDKDAIFSNYEKKEYSQQYRQVYEQIVWGDYAIRDWAKLLMEILAMIDVDFFFGSINVVKTLRQSTLSRKTTMEEQR